MNSRDETSATDDPYSWSVDVTSKDFALLVLLHFSDVGEDGGAVRLREGSHQLLARRLQPYGEAGISLRELAETGFPESADAPVTLATGEAGTAWLWHPFLVHSGLPNTSRTPRFVAQPPLVPKQPLRLWREAGDYSPVEEAVRRGLAGVERAVWVRS